MRIANLPTIEQINAEVAKRSFLEFMKYCWQNPRKPLIVGSHTRRVCSELDEAIERYKNGESSFLVINIPFRHGKSDMVSRYFPAYFRGLFPSEDVILTAYNTTFASGFSKHTQDIMRSENYKRIFSNVILQPRASIEKWRPKDREGRDHAGDYNAAGMLAGLTGLGGSLLIVDDPTKNREEAESLTIRDKIWNEFTNSLLTRRAPVSITIVCNTPWHVDDINGRIKKAMEEVPDFPKFKFVVMPAKSEEYSSGYLFPERFSKEWYEGQFASLGSYSAAGLLQCNPTVKGGKLIKTDNVKYFEELPKGLRVIRAWDLALSEKETVKDDPDFTVGIKMAVYQEEHFNSFFINTIFILDVKRGQWGTTKRDRIILETALEDGPEVEVYAEYTGLFKDSYKYLQDVLRGHRTIGKVHPSKDLVIRAAALEPVFEAGNVYLIRAPWNAEFLRELSEFPGSGHDDQLASLVTGYEAYTKGNKGFFIKKRML
jgi:predicted phage terminase large subunit-like protein